jgi:hypothetical protein
MPVKAAQGSGVLYRRTSWYATTNEMNEFRDKTAPQVLWNLYALVHDGRKKRLPPL